MRELASGKGCNPNVLLVNFCNSLFVQWYFKGKCANEGTNVLQGKEAVATICGGGSHLPNGSGAIPYI